MEDQTKESLLITPNMSVEQSRPIEGVPPIEERQVARAAQEAQSAAVNLQKEGYRPEDVGRAVEQAQTPPWGEGVEAVRKFGEVGEQPKPQEFIPESAKIQSEIKGQVGGSNPGGELNDILNVLGDVGVGAPVEMEELLPFQERLRREREQQLRFHEGALLPEAFRRTYDRQLIREALRGYMAKNEETLERPDLHRSDLARNQLADRADIFRKAQNPTSEWAPFLRELGLIDRKELAPAYKILSGGQYRMLLTQDDVEKLRPLVEKVTKDEDILQQEDGEWYGYFNQSLREKLERNKEAREILERKTEITTPAVVPKEALGGLAEECEALQKELWTRERIFIAYYLYSRAQGVLDLLAENFTKSDYAWIATDEWKILVSLNATKEGERPFGDKIDLAMRLYALLGVGGGQGKARNEEGAGVEGELYEADRGKNIRAALAHQPTELRSILTEEDINKLIRLSGKNIFCNTPRVEGDIEEIKRWVRDKIGGDSADTAAAENWGWNLFFMWGLATKFDNRRLETDYTDLRNIRKFHAPNGWPSADDYMKLRYPDSYRRREGVSNFTHGPDATYGKYGDERGEWPFAVSFFEFAIPRYRKEMVMNEVTNEYEEKSVRKDKVGQMRTLFEEWWGDPEYSDAGSRVGKLLRKLSWDGLRKTEWWRYNLQLYFGGRKKGLGLYEVINQGVWKREDLINIEALREIVKAVDYTLGGFTVTNGEIQKWLRELNADPRRKNAAQQAIQKLTNEGKITKVDGRTKTVEELSSVDFEKAFIDAIKQRIRELVLVGAIASDYERRGMLGGQLEWGDIIGPNPLGSPLTAFRQLPGIGGKGVPVEQLKWARERIQWQLQQAGFNVSFDKVVEEARSYLYSVKIPN